MRIPEPKRRKITGKGKTHSFLRLPHYILESQEWATLSANGIKLLLGLASQFRGANNGDLCLAWKLMKQRGWRSETTLNKAKDELIAGGWIKCTRRGGRHKASLYAITWEPVDPCKGKHDWPEESVASNDWRRHKSYSRNGSISPSTTTESGVTGQVGRLDYSENCSVQGETTT